MSTSKSSLFLVVLMAGVALSQAAGGIKGFQQRPDDSRQSVKGFRPPNSYQPAFVPQQPLPAPPSGPLPPPPPPFIPQEPLPAPPSVPLPPVLPAFVPAEQFPAPPSVPLPQPLPPPPARQAAIKGPGSVTPVFSAARVQAAAPIVQQQQQQVQEQEPESAQQQQQQQTQEAEVDPPTAAQDSAPAIAAPAGPAPAAAAPSAEEANPAPEPYAFNYAFNAGDSVSAGSSSREEQQDASGRVTGFYTLRGEDGRDRRVDYVADANGFRATISTNEMGTAPKDSADVDWNAQAPTDGQLRTADAATAAARQRAAFAPAAQQQQVQPQAPPQQQQQQQQPIASGSSQGQARVTSPRQLGAASTKGQPAISQLQEPFEQIRQVELKGRARKSRHAPFYLFTV